MLNNFSEHNLNDATLSEVTAYKSGGEVDQEAIRDLNTRLFELMENVDGKRGKGAAFERLAVPVIHEKLNLSPIVAGDAGFWRWLTFFNDGDFVEVVDWRYGPNAKFREQYLGLGELKKCFLAYLWFRANAVYNPKNSDPYLHARRGQSDLWTSHIIRVDFGSMPSMARAFIQFLHPDQEAQNLSLSEYRELIKELNRRNGSTLLELLDDKEALDFVSQVWAERDEWWTDNKSK